MRAPAFSLRHKLISLCAAALLACGLAPAMSFADESNAGDGTVAGPLATGSQDDSVAASFVLADSKGSGEAATPNPAVSSDSDGRAILASSLASSTTSIVSADVALDSADPVIGSLTVDGLTYAVGSDGLSLVAVALDAVTDGAIAIPSSVTYNGVAYPVTAVGPYAFYLSGATSVTMPASVASVDERAFRSSDVERITVDAGNPNLTSFDGALYSADKLRLLLIPEGRKGSVLLSCETEVVEASKFSHCSLVEAISVEEGGAAFSSWDGLLYDASGTTLLRVPAGATEITVRDGCTTIAAGAMEGCAKLERINAPASITSISPDLFESVPTVGLPAQMAVQDGTNPGVASSLPDQVNNSADSPGAEGEAEVPPRRVVASSQGLEAPLALPDLGSTSASPSSEASGSAPQLTAMVALSAADDDLPEVDPSFIEVILPDDVDQGCWKAAGFTLSNGFEGALASSKLQSADAYAASFGGDPNSLAFYSPYSETFYCQNTKDHVIQTRFSFEGDHGGWKMSSHGVNYPYPQNFQITYADSYGWYASYATPDSSGYWLAAWPATPATSISRTPTGPDLAVGDLAGSGDALFFRYGPVVGWNPNGGTVKGSTDPYYTFHSEGDSATGLQPSRSGYVFLGWYTESEGGERVCGAGEQTAPLSTHDDYYAHWGQELSFDTSSEPEDADYPGDVKPSQAVPAGDGAVPIEDPKRPGYVFEGWVIPSADGTEAVDQDLVYQGDDGKWYVDASKLSDYAGDDGRVELTARWTSVISVDVPSSVTFYADLVTQGQESREGAAEGAFGQSKVENQSEIDLRIVGLESNAVKTEGSTLGADSILKKADAATPSSSAQKLLSLYPSTKQWTADELKDPDAVGGTKAATAVDFDLDDILLEKSFSADDFTIAAGGTLNMGYRLNLTETGQQLDYDKLSTLSEGQSASIANVSYTFAGDAPLGPAPSGDETDPLYVTVDEAFITANGLSGKAMAGTYGLADIKAAADDLSTNGTESAYHALYKALLDKQVMQTTQADIDAGKVTYGAGPYFQLEVDGRYLPLQLIGICQDTKSDGTGKAGLTFQMRDIYAYSNTRSAAAGSMSFDTGMNPSATNSGGWGSCAMRSRLRSTFWGYLSAEIQAAIVPVTKFQQLYGGTNASYLQKTTDETIWLPSTYEIFGAYFSGYNESEALVSVSGYIPFQYMAYEGNSGSMSNICAVKTYNENAHHWRLRSANRGNTNLFFCGVHINGNSCGLSANGPYGTVPAFCL